MSWKLIFSGAFAVGVMVVAGCDSVRRADVEQGAATPVGTAGRSGRGGTGVPAGLRGAMTEMETLMNEVKANVGDPTKVEQTIRNISMVARDVAIAKLQTPQPANGLPTAEEREKVMATFRAMLNRLTRTLLDLEDAVQAGKPEEIRKAIDQIEKMEKAGHKEFGIN